MLRRERPCPDVRAMRSFRAVAPPGMSRLPDVGKAWLSDRSDVENGPVPRSLDAEIAHAQERLAELERLRVEAAGHLAG